MTQISLTTEQLKDFYDKKNDTIVFEASDVDILVPGGAVRITDTDRHKSKTYFYAKSDFANSSDEDVAGWWFVSKSDGQKLLIIND